MAIDNIILKIKREFSKNEKYRLFLQHVNNVEEELARERKRVTEMLGKQQELQEEIIRLQTENEKLYNDLGEYTAKEAGKKYVSAKSFRKLESRKKEFEDRFWEVSRELRELKQKISESTTSDQPST